MDNQEEEGIRVHHEHHRMLPVWFFIGALLLVYGFIILWVGLTELNHPPHVILARDHASLWGGLILIAIGGFYTIRYWPRRGRRN